MTIFNTVIGGGSGDEVEAYALGDAKNAVKDDKVNLNRSVNVLSSEEDISVVVDGLTNIRHGYITKDCVSFVGRYSWSSSTNLTTFKKVYGVWEERHTEESGLNNLVAKSPYGLFLAYSNAWKVVDGVLSPLEYVTSAKSGDPRKAVQMSATGEYCAFATHTNSAYKVVVYYKNKPLKVLTEWSKTSQTYANCFFVRKNGVDYLFLNEGIPYSGTASNYAYKLSPTGVEYLGVFTTTANTYALYHFYVGSVGDKDSVIFTTSNSSKITLDSLNILRADIDFSAKTCKLFPLSTEKASLINLLRDTYGVVSSDAFIFEPTGDANITQPTNKAVVTFDEGTREFKPFLSKATLGNRKYYNAEDKILFELKDYSVKFSMYSTLLPIEQKYVASQPSTETYFTNKTLTGIVKENNNGILKVSTVEDPNNPPPAIPDEDGLKTTINYGDGKIIINPNLLIPSGVTKSGTDLSGFTNNANNQVTTDSPFTSLSSVSTFDIVIRVTHPDDGSYYRWLAGLTDNANAFRGFDIRTESNNFLEANIYHEDGTSTYLKSGSTLPTNIKTFIKLSYNSSSGYTMSFSSDGISYTQVASAATTKPMDITAPIMYLGWRPPKQQGTYYWNGTIHLADCYIEVNGVKIWSGTKVNFGSVQVGYGYFRNTLTKPSDKYVPYDGGTLTEDNTRGSKATTMNIILGRSADMGSWTSDTEGYLSAQDAVVLGVNKKLSTPVYLWHDLSYITPAVPETLEVNVNVETNTVTLPISWKNIDGVLYEYPNGFPTTQATELEANVVEGSNNLYATRTGDSCGLAISSTSPAGVDSSAVIGTVELDSNGAITSYTPIE